MRRRAVVAAIVRSAARRRSSARLRPHRCDASASARRAPAENRSPSRRRGRRIALVIAKLLAEMPAFGMRLQPEQPDHVGGGESAPRMARQNLFLRALISANTCAGGAPPGRPPATAGTSARRNGLAAFSSSIVVGMVGLPVGDLLRRLRGARCERRVVRLDGLRELDVGQRVFVAADRPACRPAGRAACAATPTSSPACPRSRGRSRSRTACRRRTRACRRGTNR